MDLKKKLLISVSTHGDEKIGLEVLENLKKKKLDKYFDFLIANPKALKKNVRFIDTDLNRSYPGAKDSENYEERIAYENFKKAEGYEFIIDIHEASNGVGDFIIISREKGFNSFPIELVNLDVVLFWPSPKGALGQFFDNSVELEFGMKKRNRKQVVLKAEKIVADFIKIIYNLTNPKKSSEKSCYYVYGKLMVSDFSGDYSNLKDFYETNINGETFFPLLVGQYANLGIVCYKMKYMEGVC